MVSHMLGNALCLMHALEPLQVLALEPLAVVESAVPAGVCLVLGPGLRGDVACARAAELSVRKPIGPASTYQLALSLLPLPHGFLLAVSTAAWQVAGQTLCLPFARWPTASYGENSTKPHAKQPPDIHSRLGGTPVGSVAEGRTARRRGRAQRALPPPPTAGALRLMGPRLQFPLHRPSFTPPGAGASRLLLVVDADLALVVEVRRQAVDVDVVAPDPDQVVGAGQARLDAPVQALRLGLRLAVVLGVADQLLPAVLGDEEGAEDLGLHLARLALRGDVAAHAVSLSAVDGCRLRLRRGPCSGQFRRLGFRTGCRRPGSPRTAPAGAAAAAAPGAWAPGAGAPGGPRSAPEGASCRRPRDHGCARCRCRRPPCRRASASRRR